MIRRLSLIAFINIFFVCAALAQTTEFTYQGKLLDGALPPTANYDFEFRLFDAMSGGSQAGATATKLSVSVTNGIFTVQLDFGNQFTGANRFLDISVRPAGGGAFTQLTPRQPITSSPYAIRSLNSTTADLAANSTELGGVAADQFVVTADPRMTDARTPTAGSSNYIQNSAAQQAASNFNVSGNGTIGGTFNLPPSTSSSEGIINQSGNRLIHTFGNFNFFAGFNTGNFTMTGGGANAFVGAFAGNTNTTGSGNSFFGMSTGNANTTGFANSFVGHNSGVTNTEGSNNSFLGAAAGQRNSTGNSNSFIGANAGFNNTTGADNIAIGVGGGSNLTTGNNNIVIGNPGVADESNIIRIGTGQTSTFLAGVIQGNGSGLTSVNATQLGGQTASFYQNAANLNAGTLDASRLPVPLSLSGSQAGAPIISAINSSTTGVGVTGLASAATGETNGGRFQSDSTSGRGVLGFATAATGFTYGVWGTSNSTNGRGVYGVASAATGTSYGVYGQSNSPDGYGGYFVGRGYFSGNVGISTTSPDDRLHVVGNIRVETLGADGATVLCRNALNQIATCSSSFPQLGASQTWLGANTFSNAANTFTGSGAGLTGLNATNLTSGTLDADRLPNPLSLTGTVDNNAIISGTNSSTGGRGVFGYASADTGFSRGVHGQSNGTNGSGVLGVASSATGVTFGGRFENSSPDGYGVFGLARADTGFTTGVYGQSNSTDGRGVYGVASAGGGTTYGVYGQSNSTIGHGVFGWATAASGTAFGVYGRSSATNGVGVLGEAIALTGITYGVFGLSNSPDGYGGYFLGRGYFSGNVGIGTTAPQQTLHVDGLEILSTGPSAGFKFRNRGSTSFSDDWVWYSDGNIARLFRAGSGDLMTITTGGLVSIPNLGAAGSTSLCRNAMNQISTCTAGNLAEGNDNAAAFKALREENAQIQKVLQDQTDQIRNQQTQIEALKALVCALSTSAEICKDN